MKLPSSEKYELLGSLVRFPVCFCRDPRARARAHRRSRRRDFRRRMNVIIRPLLTGLLVLRIHVLCLSVQFSFLQSGWLASIGDMHPFSFRFFHFLMDIHGGRGFMMSSRVAGRQAKTAITPSFGRSVARAYAFQHRNSIGVGKL